MWKCKKCGRESQDESKYCDWCGMSKSKSFRQSKGVKDNKSKTKNERNLFFDKYTILGFITIVLFFLLFVKCCVGCGSNDSKYDDEYWRSINREEKLRDAGLENAADKEKRDRRNRLKGVSSGYSSDPNYSPTINDKGKYHTIDGKNKQIQYQGSKEQQSDLNMIDEYSKTHPDF